MNNCTKHPKECQDCLKEKAEILRKELKSIEDKIEIKEVIVPHIWPTPIIIDRPYPVPISPTYPIYPEVIWVSDTKTLI